ncbi:hypothetical protein XU18_0673 [Perkinsela sp. CCAP 1560/4]|nr:hypothetical protein XU18_0673 [Perkinsela sp. CCAP 1560/4]|eukprot:KNH08995.1 hypothetical protein XU18_0673 [Perkinsela sp. CCAP 1560/4]
MHPSLNAPNAKRNADTADRKGMTAHLVPNTINTTYSAVPWYLGGGTDASMGHQKAFSALKKSKHLREATHKALPNAQSGLKRWHPGCCNNCGADSHKTKDCVELPRKISAKHTGIDASRSAEAEAPMKHPRKLTQTDQRPSADLEAYAQSVLFNHKFQNNCVPTPTEHSGMTMRQYDDMPAYLRDDVLSYDPRTHAVKHDRFKVLEEGAQEKSNALHDARARIEAIKKFELIGEAGLLPSDLDAVYCQETPLARTNTDSEISENLAASQNTLVQKQYNSQITTPRIQFFEESESTEKDEYVPR